MFLMEGKTRATQEKKQENLNFFFIRGPNSMILIFLWFGSVSNLRQSQKPNELPQRDFWVYQVLMRDDSFRKSDCKQQVSKTLENTKNGALLPAVALFVEIVTHTPNN